MLAAEGEKQKERKKVVTPPELNTVVRPSSQALVLRQVLSYNEAPERNSAWTLPGLMKQLSLIGHKARHAQLGS